MDVVRDDQRADSIPEEETAEERAGRLIREARDLVALVETQDADNRKEQAEDLRFKAGEQYPQSVLEARNRPGEERPCLVLNETYPIVKQVTNDWLMNPPGVEAYPVDERADPKTAEVITDMLRHIAWGSSGQGAVAIAFEAGADIGRGYIVLRADYERDDSFNQTIFLDPVVNTFSVYFDPDSVLWDGSDARRCVLVDKMPKTEFQRTYPEAETTTLRLGDSGDYGGWVTDEHVWVASYYYLDYERDILYGLANGSTAWASELQDAPAGALAQAVGFVPGQVREVQRTRVRWAILTAVEVLEERTLPGTFLPVVPLYGERVVMQDGEVKRFGIIRPLRDPNLIINYAATTKTELVGLQPRASWKGPAGFMGEGAQRAAWIRSNLENIVALEYDRLGVDGLPITGQDIERVAFPPVPVALVEIEQSAQAYMQRLSGISQPAQLTAGNNRSRASLREQDTQASMANYHYVSHAQMTMLQVARICLSWFPTYYTAPQVARMLGEDGQVQTTPINQRQQQVDPRTGQAIWTVLHDLSVGQYDVRLKAGPSYQTKRQEAGDKIVELVGRGFTKLTDVAGSDLIRSLDMPGGDKIAQKLAMTEPQVPGEDMDAEQQVPILMGQLQKVQQEAQALNAHAQQLEMAAQQLTEENRELRIQQTALRAQLQGDQAEYTVQKRLDGLKLQEQQLGQAENELRLQAQITRLQEQIAQLQTRQVALQSNGQGDGDDAGRG